MWSGMCGFFKEAATVDEAFQHYEAFPQGSTDGQVIGQRKNPEIQDAGPLLNLARLA